MPGSSPNGLRCYAAFLLHNTPANPRAKPTLSQAAWPSCVRRPEKGIILLSGHNGVATRFRIIMSSMKTVLPENAPPKLRDDSLMTLVWMLMWSALFCFPIWLSQHYDGPIPFVMAIVVAAAALIHGTRRLYFATCPTCGKALRFLRQIYVAEKGRSSWESHCRNPWGVMVCRACNSVWRVPSSDGGSEEDHRVSEDDYAAICRNNLRVNSAGLIEPSDGAESR